MFRDSFRNLLPIEVFITDYDFLRPLDYYDKLRKRNYTFKKYGISEFCKILDEHMFKSTKTLSVISNGQYKCSIVSNQTLLQIGKIHRDSGSVSSLFFINSLSCFLSIWKLQTRIKSRLFNHSPLVYRRLGGCSPGRSISYFFCNNKINPSGSITFTLDFSKSFGFLVTI